MIRKMLLALATLLIVHSVRAQEESLEQVLAKHYEAIGGLDAWKAVQTIRFTGTVKMGEAPPAPFLVIMKRPDKFYFAFTARGVTTAQASDGTVTWMLMPLRGETAPREMPALQARLMKEQFSIDGPLVDYKEKGYGIELLGRETVEGTPTTKIRVTTAEGDRRDFYLDERYLPIRMDSRTTIQGHAVEHTNLVGEYREVAGVTLAHKFESGPKGAPPEQVISIDKMEVNVEVADEQFAMPPPAESSPVD